MDDFKEMDIFEKEARLRESLDECIRMFAMEYDLTYLQIIGILELTKQELMNEFLSCDDEDGEDNDND